MRRRRRRKWAFYEVPTTLHFPRKKRRKLLQIISSLAEEEDNCFLSLFSPLQQPNSRTLYIFLAVATYGAEKENCNFYGWGKREMLQVFFRTERGGERRRSLINKNYWEGEANIFIAKFGHKRRRGRGGNGCVDFLLFRHSNRKFSRGFSCCHLFHPSAT